MSFQAVQPQYKEVHAENVVWRWLLQAGGVLHAKVSSTSGLDNSIGALTTAGGVLHADVSSTSGLDNSIGALTTAAVHGIIKGYLA